MIGCEEFEDPTQTTPTKVIGVPYVTADHGSTEVFATDIFQAVIGDIHNIIVSHVLNEVVEDIFVCPYEDNLTEIKKKNLKISPTPWLQYMPPTLECLQTGKISFN